MGVGNKMKLRDQNIDALALAVSLQIQESLLCQTKL